MHTTAQIFYIGERSRDQRLVESDTGQGPTRGCEANVASVFNRGSANSASSMCDQGAAPAASVRPNLSTNLKPMKVPVEETGSSNHDSSPVFWY